MDVNIHKVGERGTWELSEDKLDGNEWEGG